MEISRLNEICTDLEEKERDYRKLKEVSKKDAKEMNHVYVQTSRPSTPTDSQKHVVFEEVVPG